ncbi:MAG: ABC transporter permease [Candidatus Methanoperedens sp.]|nr:ABC transporter permease [Candidatus Methanoperedens sp.]
MSRIFTIARWELRKTKSSFSLKTRFFSFIILILIGTASFFAAQSGLHINDNIYRVAVTDASLAGVLQSDAKFEVYIAGEGGAKSLFENEGIDILISGDKIYYHNTEKSISALDALDKAIKKYDEARLLSYNDLNNTFPVWINIKNIAREQAFQAPSINKIPMNMTTQAPETGAGQVPEEDSHDIKSSMEPVEPDGSVPVTEKQGTNININIPEKTTENIQIPSIREITENRIISPINEQNLATPSHFNPSIPFKSVVLSFIFIFPIFFIAQFFSSSIMDERIKRKGELLLVTPASSYQIVLGKLLPYLLGSIALVAIMTFKLGGSPWIILTLLPVSLMFLSTSFLGAIIARSFKELSFVLIFLSVFLSGYIFFPAMFANIHAISIISPITLVVRLLENETVSISDYMFSTLPFYLLSILIFIFGIFIYREEDLFTQKSIKEKLLDSIQEFIKRVPAPLFSFSIALLPLVFSIQLMLIVLMFNFPIRIGILLFIIVAAFVEELVKSVGIYTVFSRKMSDVTTGNALKFGILSGIGFFAGEKILLLVVIASIAGSAFGSVMGIGLLVFPLLLHVTSTTVASLGMRYLGYREYLACVVLASIVHAAYNLYLVRSVVFG